MFTRPQPVLSATSSTLASLHFYTAQISTTSCHTIRERCPQHNVQRKRRRYATIAGADDPSRANGSKPAHNHVWPDPPKGESYPTPYQIFAMTPSQAYSKTYFYHLVKLYHPDRCEFSSHHDALPLHVRIERYRLIVAAHNILSDPAKRSAYDRLGSGWKSDGEAGTTAGPFTHNCSAPSDPIWSNATWEDWERFYAKREAEEQGRTGPAEPYYMSNASFFMLVLALASVGSTYNMSRAKDNAQYFVDQRDVMHDRAAKELRRVKADKESINDRNDRVHWFMRHRDAALGLPGSDPAAVKHEMADRMLPNQDVCRSDEITQDEDD